MSCHRISRWVLRNGVEGIPPEWRDHIEFCTDCQASVAKVRMLDGLIGGLSDPDPGEAYEAGFVPRLARRLEESPSTRPVAIPERRSWAWLWAPALAAGALAFFIGRDIYLDRQPRGLTEKDIPVAVATEQKAAPSPSTTTPPATGADVSQPKPHAQAQRNLAPATPPRHDETASSESAQQPTAQESGPESQTAMTNTPSSASETGQPSSEATGTGQESRSSIQSATSAETQLYPARRVTIMGAIASDSDKNTRKDERGLPGQGPHALSDRGFVDGAPGAETAHVYHPLERLEAPQLRAAPGFPDSQSPAEALRRFDQMAELRQQIATLESIGPALRTEAQNRELCTLWYRVGTLATQRALLDSALMQLGKCLQATDQVDSQEWQTRTLQLNERLSTLPK